jgi:Na+(H+)/acetate symporter ActP
VLDDRQRAAENREAGNTPIMSSRLDAAWRKIDDQAVHLTELQRDLAQLTASVAALQNILRWMLGIITSLIVAVLIALATGHLALEILP